MGAVIQGKARNPLGPWTIGLGLMISLWGLPAWASDWVPVTPPDLEQQFIDPASLEHRPGDILRVRSLYVDRRAPTVQHTTYLTEYRCPERLFRDLDSDGQPGGHPWQSVAADPLNAQTLDYVCAPDNPAIAGSSDSQK